MGGDGGCHGEISFHSEGLNMLRNIGAHSGLAASKHQWNCPVGEKSHFGKEWLLA